MPFLLLHVPIHGRGDGGHNWLWGHCQVSCRPLCFMWELSHGDLLLPAPHHALSAHSQVVCLRNANVIWNPNHLETQLGGGGRELYALYVLAKGSGWQVFLSVQPGPLLGRVCVRISRFPHLWIHIDSFIYPPTCPQPRCLLCSGPSALGWELRGDRRVSSCSLVPR